MIERAVILCDPDGVIQPEQLNLLGQALGRAKLKLKKRSRRITMTLGKTRFPAWMMLKRKHILLALGQAEFNRSKAAKMLGMNVRTLRNKINSYRETAVTPEDLAKLGEQGISLSKRLLFGLPT